MIVREVARIPENLTKDGPFFVSRNISAGAGAKEVLTLEVTNRCERKEIINTTIIHPCTRKEIVENTITHACKIKEVVEVLISSACERKEELSTTIATGCGIKEVLKTTITSPCGVKEVLKTTINNSCGIKEKLSLEVSSACARKEVLEATITSPCGVKEVLKTTIATKCGRKEEINLVITKPCERAEIIETSILSPCGVKEVLETSITSSCEVKEVLKAVIDTGCRRTEVLKTTITGGCLVNGSIAVFLRGNGTLINVTVADHNTPKKVADEIKNTYFAGWNVEIGETDSEVIFTKENSEYIFGNNFFNSTNTGITTKIVNESGIEIVEDSYVENEIDLVLRNVSFKTIVNSKDHSTSTLVANEIVKNNFPLWIAEKNNNEIIFTATEVGYREGVNSFNPNNTGVSIIQSVVVDGNVNEDLSLTLRGVETLINVNSIDDTHSSLVAEKIKLSFLSSEIWDVERVGSKLTFTAKEVGYKAGENVFEFYGTGVTSTNIEKIVDGEINENIEIILRGVSTLVSVNSITDFTINSVASKIRSAFSSSSIWTVGGVNEALIFTAKKEGYKIGDNLFVSNETGVAVSELTPTVDGYFESSIDITLRDETISLPVNSRDHGTTTKIAEAIVALKSGFATWDVTNVSNVINFIAKTIDVRTGSNTLLPNSSCVTGNFNIIKNSSYIDNVGITLRGVLVNTPLNSATETTPEAVAAKIRTSVFSGWDITAEEGATITFTATTAGYRPGNNSFTPNTTGVTVTQVNSKNIEVFVNGDLTGNVSISLRGGASVAIPVNSRNHTTNTLVASAIFSKASLFVDWDVTQLNNKIIFTAKEAGYKSGINSFSSGYTGVTIEDNLIKATVPGLIEDNIEIILLDAAPIVIPITSITHNTPEKVAEAIRGSAFPGWVVESGTNKIVNFTADTVGARSGTNSFSANTTGVTLAGIIEIKQEGVSSGNIVLKLRDTEVTIPVNITDHNTIEKIVDEIVSASTIGFPTWVAEKNLETEGLITFTATTPEYRPGINSFSCDVGVTILENASQMIVVDGLVSKNISISLRNNLEFEVLVSSISHTTTDLVAAAIKAKSDITTNANWVTEVSGSDLTFTAKVAGYNGEDISEFDFNSTGVDAIGGITVFVDGDVVGSADIMLRGEVVNVPLTSKDHGTPKLVAKAIRDTVFPGWTTLSAANSGTVNTVVFVKSVAGVNLGNNSFTADYGTTSVNDIEIVKDGVFDAVVTMDLRGEKIETAVSSTIHNTASLVADEIFYNLTDPLGVNYGKLDEFYGWDLTQEDATKLIFTAKIEEARYGPLDYFSAIPAELSVIQPQPVIGEITLIQPGIISEDLTITVKGQPPVEVSVNSEEHYTTDLVAAKIRTANSSCWVIDGSGSIVRFTATDEEIRSGTDTLVSSLTATTTGTFIETQASSYTETFTIQLRDITTPSSSAQISVNSTDHRTPEDVATAIAATPFPGWTVESIGSTVGFIADAAEVRYGNNIYTKDPANYSVTLDSGNSLNVILPGLFDDYLGIVIRGMVINILMNSEAQNSIIKVADRIREVSFPTWTLTGSGANIVFTADIEEARFGTNAIINNGTGITVIEEIKIDVLGKEVDLNSLLNKCTYLWAEVLSAQAAAICLNEDRGDEEALAYTGAIYETNAFGVDVVVRTEPRCINDSYAVINSFLSVRDRCRKENPTLTVLKDKAASRATFLPIRSAQINSIMISESASFYYDARAKMISIRIRKSAGTLVDIYRRHLGKVKVAQQNKSTRESILYWKNIMIVKTIEKTATSSAIAKSRGRQESWVIIEVSDDENVYNFKIGETIGLIADNLNRQMYFTIKDIITTTMINTVDENGVVSMKTVKKLSLNRKIPSTVKLEKNPRFVRVFGKVEQRITL